eukprot:c9539_g1_i1.p1 GENE.c9539_g1_i1~~c9539_g1_i1.p1  ORF type:complete len:157 (-),score=56.46 c9539_g1_i1:58-528(-)
MVLNQNHSDAQFKIGDIFYFGLGVETNYEEAMKWYLKAANQNHSEAQKTVGHIYEGGFGVKQSYKEAMKWYLKSANQGDIGAKKKIGEMHEYGFGVEKNYEEALKWYIKVSDQQDDAQLDYEIGLKYFRGKTWSCFKTDENEAIKWFMRAAYNQKK